MVSVVQFASCLAFRLLLMLAVLLLVPSVHSACADEDIRTEAARILNAREFRNFPRLDRHNPLADFHFGDDLSSGHPGKEGTQDDAGTGSDGNEGAGSGSANSRGTRDDSGNSTSSESAENKEDSGGGSMWPQFGRSAVSAIASLAGPVVTFTSWLVIAAVVILLIVLVVQAIRDRLSGSRTAASAAGTSVEADRPVPVVAPGLTDPERLVQLAGELAAQARYGEAVHQLVLAALSSTERAGLVRFRRGLTLQDYLRALSTRRPAAGAALNRMARVFEPVFYGNHEASREMVERVLDDYTEGFQTIDAPRQD